MKLPFVRRKEYDDVVRKFRAVWEAATGKKVLYLALEEDSLKKQVSEYIRTRCEEAVEYDNRVRWKDGVPVGKICEYICKMKMAIDNDNKECGHVACDEVLCDLLREIGFHNVVDVYEEQEKWYS